MGRNRMLVPSCWSLVRERVMTTGFHAKSMALIKQYVLGEEGKISHELCYNAMVLN